MMPLAAASSRFGWPGCSSVAAIIVNTRFSTDMSAFLPRSPNPAQQILVDQLREGVVSRLILLAIRAPIPKLWRH